MRASLPARAVPPPTRGESDAPEWSCHLSLRPTEPFAALPRPLFLIRSLQLMVMDMSAPRWKKGKDGKDFAALAAVNAMPSIVAELQASLKYSKIVATLSIRGGDAILGVNPHQAMLLNLAAFGRAVENAGAEKQWFQLGPEEVFYLCHALKCIAVESENKNQMSERELWDHLSSASESFPEMYKA